MPVQRFGCAWKTNAVTIANIGNTTNKTNLAIKSTGLLLTFMIKRFIKMIFELTNIVYYLLAIH